MVKKVKQRVVTRAKSLLNHAGGVHLPQLVKKLRNVKGRRNEERRSMLYALCR